MDKEFDFVVKRYRSGCFDADTGWKRLGIAKVSIWRRYRAAAAVVAAVVISASAAIIYDRYQTQKDEHQPIENITPGTPAMSLTEVKVIDFENASLSEVVAKIESVYNVRIENVPQEEPGQKLSLHYEGTPTDLIDIINGILGTEMSVTEK